MQDMQVNEIMTTGSVTVGPRATVREARALLRALGVVQVPVVNDEQQLVGLVGDDELSPLPGGAADDARHEASMPRPDAHVASLMSRRTHLFVDEDDDLGAVVDLMREHGVLVVPVVDPYVKVVGIVRHRDVLRILEPANRAGHLDAGADQPCPS